MTLKKAADYIPQSFIGKRVRVVLDTGSDTIVEQSHVEETNVNKIIGRYMKSGHLPPGSSEPRYEDVSQVGDLMDIHEQMKDAQNQYDQLPDHIKEKLPFADIENVSDETLQEMFNVEQPGNTENSGEPPGETGSVPDGGESPPGAGENSTNPPE